MTTPDKDPRAKWTGAHWLAYQEGWHSGKLPERGDRAQYEGNLSPHFRGAYDEGFDEAQAQGCSP